MAPSIDIHPASDPERLEEFVLNRLSPSERERFEEHLRTCVPCQNAVQDERMLAAGIRRLGRDELKERLRKTLQQDQARSFPWARIVAAAAVVLTIIGVGLFNNWFAVHESTPTLPDQNVVEKEDKGTPEVHTSPSTPAPSAIRPQPLGTGSSSEPGKGEAPHEEPLLQKAEEKTEAKSIDAPARHAAQAPQPLDVWTTGRILVSASGDITLLTDKMQAQKPSAAPPDATPEREEMAAKKGAPGVAIQSTTRIGTPGEHPTTVLVTVRRRPLEQTPEGRVIHSSGEIPTRITRTEHGIVFTLYVSAGSTEGSEIQSQLEIVNPDSLLLTLDTLRIGYRLPARILESPTQTR